MTTRTGEDPTSDGYARSDGSRRIAFGALILGEIALVAGVLVPHDSFSMHMVQHLLFMDVAAPMLALAWPLVLKPWRTTQVVRWLNALARPAPALLISTLTLWFWHIPALYDAALSYEGAVHALEHITFIGAFVLFWRPILSDSMSVGYVRSNEGRVLYLSLGMVANGVLAAYLTFSDRLLYAAYATADTGGRSPLSDQHLGGGIMWLVGTIVITTAALATMKEEP